MCVVSRKLGKITGITFFIALIMRLYCSLDASYSLIAPNDKVAKPVAVNATNLIAEEITTLLKWQALEKSELELVDKISKGVSSLPDFFARICVLMKDKKAATPEYTALMRAYQIEVLHQAMSDPNKKSDVDQIISFMKTGADVTHVDKYGNTALQLAGANKRKAAAQFLLPLFAEHGLLDKQDGGGHTALHRATINGDVETIKALLDAGADLAPTNVMGNNALHLAVEEGNEAAIKFLTPFFAKSNLLEAFNLFGRTALHLAAYSGNVTFMKKLLAAGAHLTATKIVGDNALHIACEKGHGAAVRFLIPLFTENGMLEKPNSYGRTALHQAASGGDVKCIKELLDADAKITTTTLLGENVLHITANKGHGVATLLLIPLLSKNKMLDAQSKVGKTALQLAENNNHRKVATLLWILGATKPMTKEELPVALQNAINVIQELTLDETEGLITALRSLHENNIMVPASLTADTPLFLPLRKAIVERIRIIRHTISEGLESSLLPEIENIIGDYLVGTAPQSPRSTSSASSRSSSSSSSPSFSSSCQLQ